MGDVAVEDDPKDLEEEARGAEALGRDMGLNGSAAKNAVDA